MCVIGKTVCMYVVCVFILCSVSGETCSDTSLYTGLPTVTKAD